MKNAYIILAHKDPKQVRRLVDNLDKDGIFVFHICKNTSDETFQEFKTLLNNTNHFFCERVRSFWGEIGLVQATLNALNTLENSNLKYDYVHLLSGQDFPIKNSQYRNEFLKANNGKEFLLFWKFYPIDKNNKEEMDSSPWTKGKHLQIKRLTHYYIRHRGEKYVIPEKYDLSLKEMSPIRSFFYFLKKTPLYLKEKNLKYKWNEFRFTRTLPYPKPLPNLQFWGGSHWFSLTPKAVNYLIDFDKKDNYLKKFYEQVLLPDESYFQTVLLNSPLKANIVSDNLREIVFPPKAANPIFLEDKHFELLQNSNALFARKFDSKLSENILAKIEAKILSIDEQQNQI